VLEVTEEEADELVPSRKLLGLFDSVNGSEDRLPLVLEDAIDSHLSRLRCQRCFRVWKAEQLIGRRVASKQKLTAGKRLAFSFAVMRFAVSQRRGVVDSFYRRQRLVDFRRRCLRGVAAKCRLKLIGVRFCFFWSISTPFSDPPDAAAPQGTSRRQPAVPSLLGVATPVPGKETRFLEEWLVATSSYSRR